MGVVPPPGWGRISTIQPRAQIREEPAKYTRAFGNLMQKQMERAMRAMQSYAELSQQTGTEAAELASAKGET